MNQTFDYFTEIALGAMCAEIEIEFDVSPYTPATFMDPEEGGQVEDILGVWVRAISGETYQLSRSELGEWATHLDMLALEHVLEHFDRYELLEYAGNCQEDF